MGQLLFHLGHQGDVLQGTGAELPDAIEDGFLEGDTGLNGRDSQDGLVAEVGQRAAGAPGERGQAVGMAERDELGHLTGPSVGDWYATDAIAAGQRAASISLIALGCYFLVMIEGSQASPTAARRVRYPENLMPIAGQLVRDEAFSDARQDFLIGYRKNTARAYWSDLDDIWMWATERGKDALALTDVDVKAYVRLLRRRGYAASTVRRRKTALRGFYQSMADHA